MPTTAEQINTSLKTVTDWTDLYTSSFGIAFNKVGRTVLDDAITRYANESDWVKVMGVKRKAEIIGFSSTTIDEKLKLALAKMPMFTTVKLPKNQPDGYWWNQYYNVLNGYRWAEELAYETEKWGNPESAFKALVDIRYAQPLIGSYAQPPVGEFPQAFYRWNPDTGAVDRIYRGRWHQVAALCGVYLKFYELGMFEAINHAGFEWEMLNSVYWEMNHYTYSPDLRGFHFRNPEVFQTFIKAHKTQPFYFAPNIPRIKLDVEQRYIAGAWDAKQWGGYRVAVRHNPANMERRLDGTLGAWAVMHAFYKQFFDVSKTVMRNMLTGKDVPRASSALLASDLFDSATNRFRLTSAEATSDRATCFGCATLFLMSIVPDTGSLAIPIHAEGIEPYEVEFFNSSHFEFNYDAKRIKIPVYAGRIGFQFGTTLTSADFDVDGIYQVQFSSDWNSVINVTKVADLTATYLVEPKVPTPTEMLAANLVTMIGVIPIYALSKTLVKKAKGG